MLFQANYIRKKICKIKIYFEKFFLEEIANFSNAYSGLVSSSDRLKQAILCVYSHSSLEGESHLSTPSSSLGLVYRSRPHGYFLRTFRTFTTVAIQFLMCFVGFWNFHKGKWKFHSLSFFFHYYFLSLIHHQVSPVGFASLVFRP